MEQRYTWEQKYFVVLCANDGMPIRKAGSFFKASGTAVHFWQQCLDADGTLEDTCKGGDFKSHQLDRHLPTVIGIIESEGSKVANHAVARLLFEATGCKVSTEGIRNLHARWDLPRVTYDGSGSIVLQGAIGNQLEVLAAMGSDFPKRGMTEEGVRQ